MQTGDSSISFTVTPSFTTNAGSSLKIYTSKDLVASSSLGGCVLPPHAAVAAAVPGAAPVQPPVVAVGPPGVVAEPPAGMMMTVDFAWTAVVAIEVLLPHDRPTA